MTKVSVIICTYDRADSLARTLASISRTELPSDVTGELLVVDNGSRDNTPSVVASHAVRQMAVTYLSEPTRGQCHARNTGMAASTGDIIVFTDDDLAVPPDWLDALIRPLRSGFHAVAGGVKMAPHLERDWMEPMQRALLAESSPPAPGEEPRLVGANMAFLRDVLPSVPGFDTEIGPGRLGLGDDTLFGRQILAAGFRIAYCPEATVEHHFDPARLRRQSMIDATTKVGKAEAYMDYHWEHRDPSHAGMKLLRKRTQLNLWRARHPGAAQQIEGLSTTEYWYLREVSRLHHYLAVESRRPRNYARHGLTKLPA